MYSFSYLYFLFAVTPCFVLWVRIHGCFVVCGWHRRIASFVFVVDLVVTGAFYSVEKNVKVIFINVMWAAIAQSA
jgi:hypothetical protein